MTTSLPPVLGCRTYCPLSVVPLPEARKRKLRSVPAVQVGLVEDLVVVLVELAVVDFDAVLVV